MRSERLLLTVAPLITAVSMQPVDRQDKVTEHGIEYKLFEHAATGSTLQYVSNSGICETTPGVNQHSGYFSDNETDNMWWWFFEARQSADTAPLALWLNGGPSCSSMLGLFQENGPCTFNGGGAEPELNPNSWNNVANMLYIDQPVGTGFSRGRKRYAPTTTPEAAPAVWALLQAFLAQFPEYKSRDFGLFTESYGGHYGPEFAYYFEQQNAAIDAGAIEGDKINLIALGINNGWIDPAIQYKGYIDYAVNNTYRPLLSATDAQGYYDSYNRLCKDAFQDCVSENTPSDVCENTDRRCHDYIKIPIQDQGDFDQYDIRASYASFPPRTFEGYLTSAKVMKAIGAHTKYSSCTRWSTISKADHAYSFLPELDKVIRSGVTVLVWAGDADWICNWMGNYEVVQAIGGPDFVNRPLAPYTVGGQTYGEFKTAGTLNFLRVYAAGHEIPAYQPEAALTAFTSIISKKPLQAT